MVTRPLDELVEVEYLMNSRYLSSAKNSYMELLNELKHIPATAKLFYIKDKNVWLQEIENSIEEIKAMQCDLNRSYFGERGL